MKVAVRWLLFVCVAFCSVSAGRAFAAAGETQQATVTAHYKIILTIGPVAPMLMPEQAAGAKEGEVMVAMPGMAMPGMVMPGMGMTDQGQPVNHHLEIAILDPASGAAVTNSMPTITIKNNTTGESRTLASVMMMYDVKVGPRDTHFGNNLYLPDGTYTVTAVANGETATFTNVTVGAAAPASGGTTSGGTTSGGTMSGGTMPTTGKDLTGLYAALLVAGGLALGLGLGLRRVRLV